MPRSRAFERVTVKGYVDRVDIVAKGRMVASHRRSYELGDQVLDPLHYLVTLGRRPAALATRTSTGVGSYRRPSSSCESVWSDVTVLGRACFESHGPVGIFCRGGLFGLPGMFGNWSRLTRPCHLPSSSSTHGSGQHCLPGRQGLLRARRGIEGVRPVWYSQAQISCQTGIRSRTTAVPDFQSTMLPLLEAL